MILKTAASVLALLAILAASAQDKPQPGPKKKRDLKDRAWVQGKIVCAGCHLESLEGGADSQCTLHSKHALGFLKDDGTLWTFVDNERGHPVITNKELRDKPIQVYGWTFAKSQYVELYKYKIKVGDAWEIWDYCKT